FIMERTSSNHVLRITQMPAYDLDESGITFRGPHSRDMTGKPDEDACDPETKTESDGSSQRTVDDGDGTWRAAQKDRLDQRAVNRRIETGDRCVLTHHTVTPPPNWKNARKKLDAAKAIDRPKTIWIRRRKPPEVSPKASDKP